MQQGNPSVFVSQLEAMIVFADIQEDFVLGAWLAQALNRIKVIKEVSQGLPSATE